ISWRNRSSTSCAPRRVAMPHIVETPRNDCNQAEASLLSGPEPNGAGDAGAAESAVAHRVLREVLLVVRLGVVERPGRRDLGRDLAVACGPELLLERGASRLGDRALLVAIRIDRRAVLRADVIPLPHPLRGVVVLPEEAEDLLVARLLRVEDDEHRLGMTGAARADLLVRRVPREAAGIADRRRVDAGRLPEDALRTPEAAHPDDRLLEPVRERRRDRGPERLVPLRHADRLVAPGQRVVRGDEGGRLREEVHAGTRVPRGWWSRRVWRS